MRKGLITALSVVAPAGQLIASGHKTLEIRKWLPDIAPDEDLLIVENMNYLLHDGDEETGVAIAIVNITAVRTFTVNDIQAACAQYFEENWFAWELSNIRPVRQAREVRAARKLYHIEW
ncbi:ASCH domain-containing protein [Serratia nevei]|uniref:ASCH domain-containing protein n=1 Tax=Serratia nevei TaxID=2703794 RepID=UPI00313DE102